MGLVAAGWKSATDRHIGYYEPYAQSHGAMDRDDAFQKEVAGVALARVQAGETLEIGASLEDPRPK